MTGNADLDNRDFRLFGSKAEFTSNLFDKHTFRGGLRWQWSTAQYQYDVQERQAGVNAYKPILADVDDSGNEFNAFVQDEWQLHSKLALIVKRASSVMRLDRESRSR